MAEDGSDRGGWPMKRRSLLGGTAALAASFAAGCGKAVAADDMPETERLALLQLLADIAIPATDTTGAGTMETVRWVDTALRQGMRGGEPKTLVVLRQALDTRTAGGSFVAAPPAARLAALTGLDKELPPFPRPDLPPWGVVKSLIFRAYYTSEAGASKELAYELAPGQFDPTLPIKPDSRAYSTDQNARNLA